MFLEGSTYSIKSRSLLISAHSAVTLSNLTFLDNRLPRETWSSDPHSVSHRHLSLEMLDRAGFCSEDSMSKRPGSHSEKSPSAQHGCLGRLTSAWRLSSRMMCWLVDEFFSRKSSLRACTCMESCLSTSDACKQKRPWGWFRGCTKEGRSEFCLSFLKHLFATLLYRKYRMRNNRFPTPFALFSHAQTRLTAIPT